MNENEELMAEENILCCYNCAYFCTDNEDEIFCGQDGKNTSEENYCDDYLNEKEIEITKEMIDEMLKKRYW